MSKKWLQGTLAIVLALSLAGCSSNNSTASSSEKKSDSPKTTAAVKQEITYATTSKVVGLSPIATNDSVSTAVIHQIYETLFTRDSKTMEVKPLLAESYTTPDDKTWVIKLKKNIKFQDGTPFNAEAVKYTFDKFRDPKTAAPRASLLQPVESVTVQDEYTVVIKTKYPYGPLLAALSHQNSAIVSPTADKKQDINKDPVGTGPFKFKEWVPGDHVTLVRNDDYWQGKPKLETVTFKVVPEISTAISMLQTGQVQFIDGVPSEQLARIQSMKNVQFDQQPGTPVYYLGFNMNKKPMNDLKFRQAVSYAIDRDAYVKQLKGLGVRSNSIIGPKVFGYDKSAEKEGYNFNLEKAKKMIKDNGYEGQKLTLLVANTAAYMKMGEVVQAQLKAAGLDVKIETMEWGTFLDVTKKGNFQMTFLGWTNSTGDGSELLYPNLDSDNLKSANRMNYSNPAFDKLVMESRTSVDQAVRKEKLMEANKIAVNDAVWIPMYHGIVTAAYDKSVQGLELDPTGLWSLYGVSRK